MTKPNKKTPRCSIVIRAYNEEKHIGRLLSGIMQQTEQDREQCAAIGDCSERISGREPDHPDRNRKGEQYPEQKRERRKTLLCLVAREAHSPFSRILSSRRFSTEARRGPLPLRTWARLRRSGRAAASS